MSGASPHLHLEEAILGVDIALGEEEFPAKIWGTPKRSRSTSTDPSSPEGSTAPSSPGSDRRERLSKSGRIIRLRALFNASPEGCGRLMTHGV